MTQLERTRVTPDVLTAAGVLLCVAGAAAVYFEYVGWALFWIGAALFVVGSILDILDGALARRRGLGTPFGAFIDSTVDRVGEAFMLGAIALVFVRAG
jgi:CDP-diacylglycerol---glycerol-3-phosphate 3-phosphatidyltransferase